MDKEQLRILSIIPYKILPAKLGGEKGIAVFNEYLAKRVQLTGVTTKNNDPALAKGYTLLNFLSDNRSRYGNIFLFNSIKKIIQQKSYIEEYRDIPEQMFLDKVYNRYATVFLPRLIRSPVPHTSRLSNAVSTY